MVDLDQANGRNERNNPGIPIFLDPAAECDAGACRPSSHGLTLATERIALPGGSFAALDIRPSASGAVVELDSGTILIFGVGAEALTRLRIGERHQRPTNKALTRPWRSTAVGQGGVQRATCGPPWARHSRPEFDPALPATRWRAGVLLTMPAAPPRRVPGGELEKQIELSVRVGSIRLLGFGASAPR